MGWALNNLGREERAAIASRLFSVKEESNGWLNGICPLHEDANPSFGYNPEKDIFHCHAQCHKDGDLVDLFCLVNGLDAKAGFVEFKKKFGPGYESGATRKSRNTTEMGQAGAGNRQDDQSGAGDQPPDDNLPPADFDQMREAYAKFPPLPEAWINRLWEKRRWSREAIEQLGIRLQTFYRCRKTGELRPVAKGRNRIAIPVFDVDGILQNIRLYDPAAKRDQAKIISWGKGTGENRLFPAAKKYPPGTRVWLCEGEGDTICAISLGLAAHTQTAKRKNWPDDQVAPFADCEVIIAYDADKPGLEYAKAAADSLLGSARALSIVNWPEYMLGEGGELPDKHGQDLTDFIVRHGKRLDDLEALLPAAKVVDEENNYYVSPLTFFAMGVTGRYGFQPRLLAERLVADVELMFDPMTGQLYRWNGMYWEQYNIAHLKRQAIIYLGDEAQRSRYIDAVDQAMHLCTIPPGRAVNDQAGWLCIENGMFNIDTFELRPHHKDFYATFKINVSFDPENPEDCRRFRTFLKENVKTDEVIEQLQEFFGYCLTRETRYEMCLIMIGDGGDGKSTTQRLLRAMCGTENCTSVGFDGLEDQFQRTLLYNKMVNMSSEVGGRAMDSEYFKKIVSGDSITASYKHKDGFEFVPFVKLVFAVNKMPKVLDTTDGLYRRLLPIHFKEQYLPGDPRRDPHLETKLMGEINGIFAWSLIGLERLRKRGGFNVNVQETLDLLNEYRRMNSPVHAFVEDCCKVGGAEVFAEKTVLYKAYQTYCGRFGFGAMHAENFYNDLRRVVKGLRTARPRLAGGDRPRGFAGIGLLIESEE